MMIFSPLSKVDNIVTDVTSAMVAVFRKRKAKDRETEEPEEAQSKRTRLGPAPAPAPHQTPVPMETCAPAPPSAPCRQCQAGLPGHISHIMSS